MRESKIFFYLLCVIFYSCNMDNNTNLSNKDELSNNSIDSVIVYYKKNNKTCYDCSNYSEIFVSLYNSTETVKEIPFYFHENNPGKTNFFIKYKEKIYELYGNDSNSIKIDKKDRHNILLSLSDQYLIKNDSLTYTKFIYELFSKGSLVYIDKQRGSKVDTIVIAKSNRFKIVHSF